MAATRPPKKSETIEIRLPHETKAAFTARCAREGRTVSEAMRGFIEGELAARPAKRPGLQGWQMILAALMGLAIGGVAAPSLAHPAANARAVFEQLDRNHDGVLSYDEFSRR